MEVGRARSDRIRAKHLTTKLKVVNCNTYSITEREREGRERDVNGEGTAKNKADLMSGKDRWAGDRH